LSILLQIHREQWKKIFEKYQKPGIKQAKKLQIFASKICGEKLKLVISTHMCITISITK
jgi:hypothetical protein